jgi:hypothetical protein
VAGELFDLRFFEFDVFLDNGIVFFERQFLGQIPGVLVRNIIIARPRRAYQFDFLSYWLSHDYLPNSPFRGKSGQPTAICQGKLGYGASAEMSLA